jgi:acetyl esterase/lipase
MKKSQKPTAVDNVPNTQVQGVWFGDANTATTIMVYYPGGGHVIPGLAIHAAALDRWTSWCQGRLAIFAIQYSLAPAVMYPTAIGESVEAVRFVLQGPGKGKEIMVGGDSAGGQIALAVMSHLGGHPHPDVDIVRPLDLQGGKVKGVILLSPWTSSDTARFASITELSGVDIIGPTAIKYWSGLYQGSKPDDPYIVPEMADANWWMGIGEVTQSIFVSYGQDESFKDAITSWARKFQQGVGNDKVRVVAGENEGHNGPLGLLPERELAAEIFGHEKSAEGALRYWLLSLVGLM